MIRYVQTSDFNDASELLLDRITNQLAAGKKVLWFIAGGSCIPIAVSVSRRIDPDHARNLSITLTDERFGDAGHSNSNMRQLEDAGFSVAGANIVTVLQGKDRRQTTHDFTEAINNLLARADHTIGLFGIGKDGHTAGILPGSIALNANQMAVDYTAADFERITITPKVIAQLNEAVLYAKGQDKWPALKALQNAGDITKQPAQLLKMIPELSIYSDYKGE